MHELDILGFVLAFTLPIFLLGGATAKLVESTPFRLRYELTSTGVPPSSVIPNAGGATPDLKTDNLPPSAPFASPLRSLLDAPVSNQEQARAVLMGHQNVPGAPNITKVYRAHTTVTPRQAPDVPTAVPTWTVDVNEGAAAGDPASAGRVVIVVQAPGAPGYTAELDVYAQHTFDQ